MSIKLLPFSEVIAGSFFTQDNFCIVLQLRASKNGVTQNGVVVKIKQLFAAENKPQPFSRECIRQKPTTAYLNLW